MRTATDDVIKAVYDLLLNNVQNGTSAGPYELSYVRRVSDDGGIVELSTCFSENSAFSDYVPVYTSQIPTFNGRAYIYIYGLNSNEVGPSDNYTYSVALTVKCAISNESGIISAKDINTFGNTVLEILQPDTFARVTVTGYSVINQQLQAVNYIEPVQNGSRYEFSVNLDWLIDVMEV